MLIIVEHSFISTVLGTTVKEKDLVVTIILVAEWLAWPQLNSSKYVNTALSIVTQMIVLKSVMSLSGDELRVVHFNSLMGVTIIPNSLVGYQLFAIRWWGFLRISTFRIWGLKVGSWHIISSVRNNFGHF